MTEEQQVVSDLVIIALESALQHENACRLLTSGKKAGLLTGKRGSNVLTNAIAQCRCATLNLFTITECNETKGKTVTKYELAAITRGGIQLLFERRTPVQRQELLEKCANPHKELAQEVLLSVTEHELHELDAQQTAIDQRAARLRSTLKRIVEDQLAVVEQSKDRLDEQHAVLQNLIDEITQPHHPILAGVYHRQASPSGPITDGDLDFQLQLCRELVFAWQDASDPKIRTALEPAMLNAGLEPVGEVGETVSFDNRDHRTESDLMPGQPAVILERGWLLTSPRGTRLISPAHVKSTTSEEGDAVYETHAEH